MTIMGSNSLCYFWICRLWYKAWLLLCRSGVWFVLLEMILKTLITDS